MQAFTDFAMALTPPPNPVRRLDNSLTAAQANVTLAAQELAQAEAAYEPYRNKPDGNINKAYYGAAWAAAQQAYDTAVAQLNALTGTAGGPMVGDDDAAPENRTTSSG